MERSRIRKWLAMGMALMLSTTAFAAEKRIRLEPSMLTNESNIGEPEGMVDEQDLTWSPGTAPVGTPKTPWAVPSNYWKGGQPATAYIDLGEERYLSKIWFFDTNGKGDVIIETGTPGNWTLETTYDCGTYMSWVPVPLAAHTRYVRLTRKDGGSNFTEIALFETTAEEHAIAFAKRQEERRLEAERQAEAARKAAEKEAALAKAREELANRPVIDIGEPFGKVILVDEIDVGAEDPGHMFEQDPADATEVKTILGKRARVLRKTPGEAAHMTFRIGQYKLLKPGGAYVLEVEYPEDAPRSMVILNGGNETSQGFHTSNALGDAFRPKYVDNINESIKTPLAQEYRTWRMFFNLHHRFPADTFFRGAGTRALTPDDGFKVTIAQFSAENLPISEGAAVSRIRLYEVPDPEVLNAKYTLPEGLPHRHLFWREEMADNAIQAPKGEKAAVDDPLDWYRFKANQMAFLGMNTFTKDLLEFGAVQHWDSTPHGGNNWAYFDGATKDLWRSIVEHMGQRGFTILPYYEYAGSKGKNGLGPQRRAKPLTRDDAFTHIKWIESANADITDPDTYEDFKKMLEITVLWQRDKAKFAGIWLRPRSQLPMGFGDGTRKRFAEEANGGVEVTREDLKNDKELLARYKEWWFGKRRQFLEAMRDYLRENGVEDPIVLYTAFPQEPGPSFRERQPVFVADDVESWQQLFANSNIERDTRTKVVTPQEVAEQGLYMKSLLNAPANWGGWELDHANPPADPHRYRDATGIMLTHPFNRLYTVLSPETLSAFRGPAGLAIIRHYSLNENMMFDKNDKPKLGYFCADIERAGPYCMMAEAMAMANGDPTHIGYLRGRNFARGFPEYVRNFNTAFLSLPALPSVRLEGVSSDEAVVVRAIETESHGTYLAIVNTAMTDRENVTIKLPKGGKVTDAATGQVLGEGESLSVTLYPFQLRALRVQ